MLHDKTVRKSAEPCGYCDARNRKRAAEQFRNTAHELRSNGSKAPVAREEILVRSRMTDSKELKFDREERQSAISGHFGIVTTQIAKKVFRIAGPPENGVQVCNALRDPLFEQRKENVFLTLEVGVESTAGVARTRGDVFQARGFEAVAGKNFGRGSKEAATSDLRARLLPGNLPRRPCEGGSFTRERASPDQARPLVQPTADTYMHVYYLES